MRPFAFVVALLLALPAGGEVPDFTLLVRQHAPAVVSIASSYATPPVLPDIPQDEFSDLLGRVARGIIPDFDAPPLGSGFIVSSDGYIVTAWHIVEDAVNQELVVRLVDGREYLGRVVGSDRASDIGLVKIQASGLPQVRIGEPGRLQPGEWVLTMGTPLGFERSVTAGLVSTTARAIPSETHIRFIQTDLAVNPGHSGGPLFNLSGEVVGVNSLIYSHTGGSIGLSFAVPIDVAMRVVDRLRAGGPIRRGRLGVRSQEVSAELARAFHLPRAAGALITAVERHAPAERAGLRAGDVVTRFAGKPVQSHVDLLAYAADTAPGTVVTLELVRNGAPQLVKLRLAPADEEREPAADTGATDRFGLRLAPMGEAQRRRLGESGVVIQRAEGAARRAGLFPGDVILSVNGRATSTLDSFRAAAERARTGDALALLVERVGNRAFIPLRVP